MFGNKWEYHYSRGRKKAWVAGAVILIIVAAGAFLYLNSSRFALLNRQESPGQNITPEKNLTQPAEPGQEGQASGLTGTTVEPGNVTIQKGLLAEYYSTLSLDGDAVAKESVPKIDFSWSASSPPPAGAVWNRFSARFTSRLLLDKNGTYTFTLTADDGARLTIDGFKFANFWDVTGLTSKMGSKSLLAGEHDIVVEYRNLGGNGTLKLEYASDELNITRQVIPEENFMP